MKGPSSVAVDPSGEFSYVMTPDNQPPPSNRAIAIVESISPTPTSLEAGTSQLFTATVRNDPANEGVTWGLGGCPGACGTIDPT
jgi:hypothetical protein